MGCDIHIFIEQPNFVKKYRVAANMDSLLWLSLKMKIKGQNGKFKFNLNKLDARNYKFFAYIANVRGEGPYEPKGLPSDVSDQVKEYIEDNDLHSASYDSLPDFIWKWHSANDIYLAGWIRDALEDSYSCYRVVYAFDS